MKEKDTILHRRSMLALGIVMGVILVVLAWFEKKNNDELTLNKIVKTASLYHSTEEKPTHKHKYNQEDSFLSVRNLLSFQQSSLSEK